MRRFIIPLLLGLTIPLVLSSPTHAASVSTAGAGDITKLTLNNTDTKVLFKIFAPAGPIGSVEAVMKDGDGTRYSAVIINSTRGDTALYKGGPVNPVDASCPNLSISYNDTSGFWRVAVPRSCLGGLAGKIKGQGIYHEQFAPSASATSWTTWVRRG
jgi:hypothetical protein